jgi:hypothetical protein
MSENKNNPTVTMLLIVVSVVLVFVLGFSLYKNISYPLMWGDEGETAMLAERILDYGYPKVHAGNNSLNVSGISGENTGIKTKYDASVVSMWGQYYFAAIGAHFARQVSDMFTKTAIMRIPFATIGLIGVLLLPFSVLFIFKKKKDNKLLIICGYLFFQILSVSLMLHLREVRSYSLAVFFLAATIVIFNIYYFGKKMATWLYVLLMTLSLVCLQNSFPPAYLPAIAGITMYVMFRGFILESKVRKDLTEKGLMTFFKSDLFRTLLPFGISVLIALPILSFFGTSKTSAQSYKDISYGFATYTNYVLRSYKFLMTWHYLALAIFLKVVLFSLYKKAKGRFTELNEKSSFKISKAIEVSVFLTYFLIVYSLLVAFTPFMFDRYFVFLQPLLSLIIVLDFVVVMKLIPLLSKKERVESSRTGFLLGSVVIFLIVFTTNIDVYAGRIYELTHRYTGPVDQVILYIKENYKNPEKLTISTNTESTSYMYYLGSSVICDDKPNCYEDPPDIVLPRNYLISDMFIQRFNRYLSSAKYKIVYLPIADYPSNNIPEFSLGLRHLFQTPATTNKNLMVVMYVKE